ncbi:ABC transporter ATP-binding protein [Exiguobacterium acetylicum]|uniref:ABC transporter ATP-binding protein n=1 Tax=Exiguobacterium acetylicum TaxID=41170 RepID=UPI001EE275B6|nr:dipeptide/oligopeptide/nickel ABC transporter ATP-binding protein [Exiguobacterium acetylicum]UKS54604.1 dipeptide/oligopeptide/nickel ABC transporter ATP-binding protein [Exiguobacterium acetylicum]
MSSVLSVTDLTYQIKEQSILSHISFQVMAKSSFGIIGESGSGKTTLGRVILGLLEPSQGAVSLHGKAFPSGGKNKRRAIQAVFQHPLASFNPEWTVRESILEPFRCHRPILRHFPATSEEDLISALGLAVGVEARLFDRLPHQLSGGQIQRAAIARAISIEPDVIVMDEPTTGLDVVSRAHIIELLERLQQTLGVSFVLISHDIDFIRRLCSEILVLRDGRAVDLIDRLESGGSYTQRFVEAGTW